MHRVSGSIMRVRWGKYSLSDERVGGRRFLE